MKCKFVKNTVKHQKGDTECGVYAIFYILQRLKNVTMKQINSFIVSDRVMNDYRHKIFLQN